MNPKQEYYAKRGAQLVKNLRRRQFEAYYTQTRQEATWLTCFR